MCEPDGILCPDVTLLDLNSPKVDGPEVLAGFRKHPFCGETPVIVITSSDALRDRDRIADFGGPE
jgi:CheY-like chemotaxis protein